MATINIDGTSSQTASKSDTVVLTANPAFFTGASELNGNVVLTFGSQTLTVTGTTLVAGGLPGVTIPNGAFNYATTADVTSNVSGNTLSFLLGTGTTTTIGGSNSTANSVSAAFGGLGRSDSLDGAETVTIATGSKGSFLVYGNAGADSISAGGALDSNTATTVFGGRGADTINLGTQSSASSNFAVYGGEDGDSININHTGTGSLTIFGGTAAADSADGADSIALGTGTVGTLTVYAGGGADIITSTGAANGAAATFASGANATFFGGAGNDTITVGGGAQATITVYGGEGGDSIAVANVSGGTATVYGGTAAADSADAADSITLTGAGSFAVYGDGGNDVITATGLTASTGSNTTTLTVFGGRGDDSIIAGSTTVKANLALYGSENAVENTAGDTITASNAVGGSTIVYGGTSAADSADGKDSITITGSGATTVYAGGGDDTINVSGANAVADSTNTITVFGGNGNDSIALGSQTAGVNGAITITGGAGADTISLTSTAGANPSTGQNITITDFVTGTGGDKLALTTGVATAVVTANGANAQTLQQALDLAAANTTQGQVGVVAFQGNTYVVIDNDTGTTFSATNDVAIKLTGITDVAAVAAAITIA